MKKTNIAVIAALLALTMAFTGCTATESKKKKKDKDDDDEIEEVEDEDEEEEEEEESEPEETTTKATETETETSETTAKPAETSDRDGGVQPTQAPAGSSIFENELMGCGCDLGDWIVAPDSQLAEISSLTETQYASYIENTPTTEATTWFVLYASNDDGTQTLNAVFEVLSAENDASMSEAEYVEMAAPLLESSLESVGISDIEYEPITVDFCGAEHAGLLVAFEYGGQQVYEQQVVIKTSGCMVTITACTYYEDETDDILAKFYAL